jgi:hypothetical protein
MPPAAPRPLLAVILVAAAILLLTLWFLSLFRRALQSPPLRRTVDPNSITGIEQRYRTRNPDIGRRLLASLGTTPAVLVPLEASWYILVGSDLTVSRRRDHHRACRGPPWTRMTRTPFRAGRAILRDLPPVEYTARGRPSMRAARRRCPKGGHQAAPPPASKRHRPHAVTLARSV